MASSGDVTPRSFSEMTAASRKSMMLQQEESEKLTRMVEGSRAEPYLNYLIDRRQSELMYEPTLLWARACKGCLVFFVFVCVMGLLTGFLFKGEIGLLEEMNSVEEMALPKVALCPQPWGSRFAIEPVLEKADLLTIPTGAHTSVASNYSTTRCPAHAERCRCYDFTAVSLRPKARDRAGEYSEWQYLRLEFQAANAADDNEQYAFGFYAEDILPQTWSYATLGYITEGDISAEEVAHGKTEFTDGEPSSRFSFRRTGESENHGGRSVLLVGYDVFLLYVIASVGSKWSMFALVTLLITFCAAVNNFGLFEIVFPDQQGDGEPAPLVVSPLLTVIFSPCCVFCTQKGDRGLAAGEEDALEQALLEAK